jgi:hypothetical protein
VSDGPRHRRTWRAAVAAGAAVVLAATCAAAHHATPEQVVARLNSADMRVPFDIASVERSPEMPRMLLVRVGKGWAQVDAVRRVEIAEEWYTLWRDAVPNGTLAIVDAADRPRELRSQRACALAGSGRAPRHRRDAALSDGCANGARAG